MRRHGFFWFTGIILILLACSGSGSGGGGNNTGGSGDSGGGDGGGGGGGSPTAVADPTFSPAGGAYGSAQNVTITTSTTGATICYRTDGIDPAATTAGTCDAGSTAYSTAINVSSTTTIKALATMAGMLNSSIVTATYTIDNTAPTPGSAITFSGTTDTSTTVSWGAASDDVTPAAQLQYRVMRSSTNNMGTVANAETNGTEVMAYTANTTTFNATGLTASTTYWFAVIVRDQAGNKALYTQQSVTTSAAGSVAAPTFSPVGGTYNSTQNVTITSATPGATICYRTDGTDPTAPTPGTCGGGSTTYTGPVVVSSSQTIKALGTKTAMTNSSVASATYTIDTVAPTVSSTTPANAATGVARNTTIAVTFSEAMNTATISTTTSTTCTGSLQVSNDDFTTCVAMTSATPTASGGNTIFTMTPAANLVSASTYKVRVTTAAQDVAGNALASTYTHSTGFTTRYSKTITIDGTNDFSASETFSTSSGGYTAYLTWDENYVYLGMDGGDVGSGSSTKWVLAYFAGTGGSTMGLLYNTQQPNMPTGFSAKYHLRWKADDSYTNAQSYGTGWTDAGWSFTGNVFRSGNFIEFRIARSDIGNPTTLGIIVNMINEQNMAEGSYAVAPNNSFTDGYDPNYAKYFSCNINSSSPPTTACSIVP